MAIFPKSPNKDSLPVYNIPSERRWAAYLRNDNSSHEGSSHLERNCIKLWNWKTKNAYSLLNIRGIPLDNSFLSRSYKVAWFETSLAFHACASQIRNWKLVGVVNHVLDRRGSQFYAFNEEIFTTHFLWQKFLEIPQIFTKLWQCVQMARLAKQKFHFISSIINIKISQKDFYLRSRKIFTGQIIRISNFPRINIWINK